MEPLVRDLALAKIMELYKREPNSIWNTDYIKKHSYVFAIDPATEERLRVEVETMPEVYSHLLQREVLAWGVRKVFASLYGFATRFDADKFELVEFRGSPL